MGLGEGTFDTSIPDFYAGRSIFITGGNGFIGKVLIEKILRSCNKVNTIYILLRSKKGKSPEERLQQLLELPLYDRLKQEQPGAVNKIIPISGDVSELNLGLSHEDRQILINEVSVIFHVAASVRFDDHLQDAILLNTRGTREVCALALDCSNLAALVHISTTYCNTDRKVIDEIVYPPHADWRESIRLAETVDRHTMDILTQKYLGPLPNTYTFTKSMSEHTVQDMCKGKVPAVIVRPSIVISTLSEPVPGWIDNFNGPVGILVASGKGVLRSIYTDPNIVADYVPVDLVVRGILCSAWRAGTSDLEKSKEDVSVYNMANNDIQPITMGQIVHLGKVLLWEISLDGMLWYPNGQVTKCYYHHFLKVIFYHLLPALFIDGLLFVTGRKPMLIKIQRRIYIANMALQYFIRNEWKFCNRNTLALSQSIPPEDKSNFSYEKEDLDIVRYFRNAMLGGRQYLLKEPPSTLERSQVVAHRMWILAQIVNFLWYVAAAYLLFIKYDILHVLWDKINDFYVFLITDD